MRFALELGGGDALMLLARHHPRKPAECCVRRDRCSMATWGGKIISDDDAILAVVGQPLREKSLEIPQDLAGANEMLAAWDGAFAAAYWNSREQRLLVVTDFLGLFPLYLQLHCTGLRLATQTQAFRISEPSVQGWACFIAVGFTLGDTTLCQSVERVPAGRSLIFDAFGKCVGNRPTWKYPAPAARADAHAILAAARRSRDRYLECAGPADSRLLLSGGFDSRFIGCLLAEAGVRPHALTVDNEGEGANTEGLLARRVAGALSLPLGVHRADPDFFSSGEYLDYLACTDAATPSLELFIAQIAQFIAGAGPVWEGLLPGATLVNLHNPGSGFKAWHEQEGAGRSPHVWRAAEALFVPDFVAALRDAFRAVWKQETARYADNAHGVAEFVLRNRSRNRTAINPLKVFNVECAVYLPGATRDFIEAAQSVPFQDKAAFKLYLKLFEKFPQVKNIPYISASELISTQGGAYSRTRLALRMRVHDWFVERPRIAHALRLPLPRSYFVPSAFAHPASLAEVDDPLIRADADLSPAGPPHLASQVRKLAFHWLAWKHLHRGGLQERFPPR